MINEPAVDKLVEKLGTKEHPASRYELCVVVAKEIAFACREIESGKLSLTRD